MLYLVEQMQVLRVRSYDPAEEHRSVVHLLTQPPDTFNHVPTYQPKVERDEELLAVGAKKRMGVVCSIEPTGWQQVAGVRVSEAYLLVPLYSFHEDHSDEFRLRVRAFEYPSLIYAPAEPSEGISRDGFFLVERAQFVSRQVMQPANVRLTEEAQRLLEAWLVYVITGAIDPDLLELRAVLMQQLL